MLKSNKYKNTKSSDNKSKKIHKFENSSFKKNKKIRFYFGEYDEILIIIRSNSDFKNIDEFSVIYKAYTVDKWYIIRKHCWMDDHEFFHTHVRIGVGRKKFITIYPPIFLKNKKINIKKALKWAKNDIITNWYSYRQKFEKMIKLINKNKK